MSSTRRIDGRLYDRFRASRRVAVQDIAIAELALHELQH
jgi:hypothetical protein